MPKKIPLPKQQPDIDNADELSEKELERKRRQEARREEKRQKQELRRIEREMKEPVSKWVWVSVAVIIVLLLAISWGGYVFWASYTVNLQRKSFMDNYSVAELTMLRRYAPDELKRVEELKATAENADGALSHGQVVETYREAEDALAQAQARAEESADDYEAALARFRTLRQQAVEHQVDEYASLLWKRVEEAEQAATETGTRDFSVALATEKLNQAIDLLRKIAEAYPQIEQFDAAHSRFTSAFEGLSKQEAMRNAPDAWSTIQTRINRAEAAREASNWEQATRLYTEAADAIAPMKETVERLKNNAEEAVSTMRQAVQAAQQQAMPQEKPEAWQRIQQEVKRAQEAWEAFEYRNAADIAAQVTSMLGEAGESARKAKQSLATLKEDVRSLYEKARAEEEFFTRNYADQWQNVTQRIQNLADLEQQKTTFEMVEIMTALKQDLEKLIQEKNRVFSDLASARQRLANVAKAPMFKFLDANYPAESQEIAGLRQAAQRRLEQADLREARDLLLQAADAADELLKKLVSTRSEVLRLRAGIGQRRQQFDEGIRRFMPGEIAGIRQRFERLEALIENNRYKNALELADELDHVVPKSRYQARDNGTVIDFERGVMWIADGTSPVGGNSGRTLDWYAALNWADRLSYAGRTDWRLPVTEELKDLYRLPDEKLKELFPNTQQGIHWTNLPSQDVDQALAVDVATGRTSRQSKHKAFHVRAVSQPGLP